jgi:predicted aspartyl protease
VGAKDVKQVTPMDDRQLVHVSNRLASSVKKAKGETNSTETVTRTGGARSYQGAEGSQQEDEWILKNYYESKRRAEEKTNTSLADAESWLSKARKEMERMGRSIQLDREQSEWTKQWNTRVADTTKEIAKELEKDILPRQETTPLLTPTAFVKKEEPEKLSPVQEVITPRDPRQGGNLGALERTNDDEPQKWDRETRRKQNCEKARSLAPSEQPNEVRVSLGRTQVQVPVGPGAEVTAIHPKAWNDYVLGVAVNGALNGSPMEIQDYKDYRLMTKRGKKKQQCSREIHGGIYMMHGPYNVRLVMEGFGIHTPVYVAVCTSFPYKITLGENMWIPHEVEALLEVYQGTSEKQEDEEKAYELSRRANTDIEVQGIRISALVDSGAGPSVMTRRMYERLGGDMRDLEKMTNNLTAANNCAMRTYGTSDMLRFQINGDSYDLMFTIVGDLGGDDVILGRDFMIKYDVVLDLTKGKLIIRNSQLRYRINSMVQRLEQRVHYQARAREDFVISPEEIRSQRFEVSRKKKACSYTEEYGWSSAWQAWAEAPTGGMVN